MKHRKPKSSVWKSTPSEMERYRVEFQELGYDHMAKKYHLAKGDIKRLF